MSDTIFSTLSHPHPLSPLFSLSFLIECTVQKTVKAMRKRKHYQTNFQEVPKRGRNREKHARKKSGKSYNECVCMGEWVGECRSVQVRGSCKVKQSTIMDIAHAHTQWRITRARLTMKKEEQMVHWHPRQESDMRWKAVRWLQECHQVNRTREREKQTKSLTQWSSKRTFSSSARYRRTKSRNKLSRILPLFLISKQ